jgi:hypothetical protein
MNDPDNLTNAPDITQDRAASAEQLQGREPDPEQVQDRGPGTEQVAVIGDGRQASLLEDSELQSINTRWKEIQAGFVDEPAQAVREADALVAELMERLTAMFATERGELEARWKGDGQVSTEDLRQGLRRYRSFFERLLAV